MELRRQFMQDVQSGATPITELCVAYGISRKTGYQWLTRYEAGGLTALGDRSRQPADLTHGDAVRAGAGPARGAATPPDVGPPQAAPVASAAGAVGTLARAQYDCSPSAPRRARRHTAPRPPARASRASASADGYAECRLDGGLQGAVQDGGRGILLSVDGGGWLQPLLVGLPGIDLDRACGCSAGI